MWKPFFITLCTFASLAPAQQQPAAPADASDFSLTVYSTADPATFDPQELARQQISVRSVNRICNPAGEKVTVPA